MKHQKVIIRKVGDRTIEKMGKYALMNRCHRDLWLQVYMYNFMHYNTMILSEEDYFLDTKTFSENNKKISTPGLVSKTWIGFSYIRSEYYYFDIDFDESEINRKPDNLPNEKESLFARTL